MMFQRRRGRGTATVLLKKGLYNIKSTKKTQTKNPKPKPHNKQPVEKVGARGLQTNYVNSSSWRNMDNVNYLVALITWKILISL